MSVQYQGLKSIYDATLGEYAEKGFTLREVDDHLLELRHNGNLVCVFGQTTATIPHIHAACQGYLISWGLI